VKISADSNRASSYLVPFLEIAFVLDYNKILFILFQGSIHEYLEMMISVHHAFTDRSNALHHVQSLSADLFFLHTRAEKLESVSSRSRSIDQEWTRHQKLGGLKETISATEAAKSHALKEYENIKVNHLRA
jgi:hypothetical protein